jgi:predicted RND superfamily exporter protein
MSILPALEAAMSGLFQFVYRHRFKSLLVVLLAVAGLVVTNLPNLQKDGRVEAFMHANDPALTAYYGMRREFGQDNRLVIAVSAPDVFDRAFLEKLSVMHDDLARGVPYVSEIFSPYNIPFIAYENGGVYLEELVRNLLARGRDPHELRERILSTPLYRNFIVSEDGTTVSIVIEPYRYAPSEVDCVPDPSAGGTCQTAIVPLEQRRLLGAPQYIEMTAAAREIAARYQADDFDIHIAGAPVVSTEIVNLMETDMPRFTLACVIITVLTMLAVNRSLLIALGAFLSFATAIFSTLATISATGTAMTPPVQLLIPMTLVVVLCTYIHFTAALLKARARVPDGRKAVDLAVKASHTPILFTALTTAGGLLGLVASPLAPITALGVFGVVSVGLSFLLAMFWATIVFRTLPERFLNRQAEGPGPVARAMARLAGIAVASPVRTLALSGAVVAVASTGIAFLQYSHNSLLWLPKDNPARTSTEFIDARYHGTVNMEVVIRPEGGRDFRDEALLKTVEATARSVYDEVDIPIGRHTSMISFLEETNQAIRSGDPAERRIPGQEEIWDQLLLLEGQGNDDVKRYVSMDYGTGRVSFQTPWLEAKLYADVITTVEDRFRAALGDTASVEATGLIALLAKTSTAVLDSMTTSYLIALVLVTAMMALALKSVGLGVVSMVPNVVPFLVLLGIMGFLGIPLDTFTVLIGAIITGLIVDDTLHFFHKVRERLDEGHDVDPAVRGAMNDIGGAIFATTIVVMVSFAVFTMSGMANIRAFGMLMVMGSALALLAEVVVGPAVIALYVRWQRAARGAQGAGLRVSDVPA